jgi:hypothetical protein
MGFWNYKMSKKIKIVIDGYLKSTYLDREGEKRITLEYSASEAIKLAQLELLGRDLNNHLPVLLRTSYEVSPRQNNNKTTKRTASSKVFR